MGLRVGSLIYLRSTLIAVTTRWLIGSDLPLWRGHLAEYWRLLSSMVRDFVSRLTHTDGSFSECIHPELEITFHH